VVGVVSAQFSLANIGGTFKSRAYVGAGCQTPETLTAGPVNGVVTSTSSDPIPTYSFQLDSDTFVFFERGFNLGIVRRYSTNPNATPCPAF
jgi:hypothetical protein